MTNNDQFSPRELDVIQLLILGKSNKEIAQALAIANRTVESHLSSIYNKLSVTSRTEAVIKLVGSPLRESTGDPSPSDQGNPQLKINEGKFILSPKRRFYVHGTRKEKMKNTLRVILLVLLTILVCVLIFAVFSALRSN